MGLLVVLVLSPQDVSPLLSSVNGFLLAWSRLRPPGPPFSIEELISDTDSLEVLVDELLLSDSELVLGRTWPERYLEKLSLFWVPLFWVPLFWVPLSKPFGRSFDGEVILLLGLRCPIVLMLTLRARLAGGLAPESLLGAGKLPSYSVSTWRLLLWLTRCAGLLGEPP